MSFQKITTLKPKELIAVLKSLKTKEEVAELHKRYQRYFTSMRLESECPVVSEARRESCHYWAEGARMCLEIIQTWEIAPKSFKTKGPKGPFVSKAKLGKAKKLEKVLVSYGYRQPKKPPSGPRRPSIKDRPLSAYTDSELKGVLKFCPTDSAVLAEAQKRSLA